MEETLRQDIKLLEKQLKWLKRSFDACSAIPIKAEYNEDEFGQYEILCSRYSRGIDFLIRKVFRSIDTYEFENQGTLIDVINHAHKRGLFEDIEELRTMKDIRNTIVHEYVEEALADVFEDVLKYTGKLISIIENTLAYTRKTIH